MSSYTLIEQLKIRLQMYSTDEQGVTTFDNSKDLLLQQLIDEAVDDVARYRQYPPTWDKEKIIDDLSRYDNVVLKLALYDYNKIGAEFETSNVEDANTHNYITRQSILNDVMPLVTVL